MSTPIEEDRRSKESQESQERRRVNYQECRKFDSLFRNYSATKVFTALHRCVGLNLQHKIRCIYNTSAWRLPQFSDVPHRAPFELAADKLLC